MFMKEKKGSAILGTSNSGMIQTVIGEGTEMVGTIKSTTLRVDGIFKGNIDEADYIIIGETGRVEGDIRAKSLLIAGNLKGNAYISERLELASTGIMNGDIDTNILTMTEGASFSGNCKMKRREEKFEVDKQAESVII